MSKPREAGLTIGAVAARTGLSVPVLRSWEQRYGFPSRRASPAGTGATTRTMSQRILRVIEARPRAGRSRRRSPGQLDPSGPAGEVDGTIYAGLRRRRPDLEVRVLGRRAMLALSHAIEDECLAYADQPTVRCLPTIEAYEQSLPRWRELARSGASTLVFADFARSGTRHGVQRVPSRQRPAGA